MTAFGLALVAIALVLGVSGATKVAAPQQTEDAFEALRIPFVPGRLGAAVLPWGELALAGGLLVLRGPWLVAAGALALILSLTYTAIIARALTFAEPVTCSCFGAFGAAKVSTTTLWRNIVMSVVAFVALLAAVQGTHVWGLVSQEPWWLAVSLLVAALFALVAAGSGTTHPSRGMAQSGTGSGEAEEEELDYLRLPIPYATLLEHGDSEKTTTLRDLARTQARLLLFLSAGCGSCRRTAENVEQWAASLSPAVGVVPIYTYAPSVVEFEIPWFLQPHGNASQVLESFGTPSAVLLGADGFLAGGPIAGEDSVRRFVEEVLEQIHDAQALTDDDEVVSGDVT